MKQLMVIRIMQQSGQGGNLRVAAGLFLRDQHGIAVDPHRMIRAVAAGITRKKRLNVLDRRFNDGHPVSSLLSAARYPGRLRLRPA